MATLNVEIVTNERIVYSESDVDMVVAPGMGGVLGILPSHAPLITTLASGELRVKKGGQEHAMVVFGGFMEVTPDKVIVLADAAERVEEIDVVRAEAARRRAEEAIAGRTGEVVDLAAAEARLQRATIRLRVSDRRRRRRPGELPGGSGDSL